MSKAFLWKLLERFGVQGIKFVLQIILARLLVPEHYGVLSIMIIFTNLANVFIQNGFNTALIQNKEVSEEDYSSVLWVSLGIAGFMYGIIYLSTPLIASFYKMPDIIVPLRVLALMLFPGALNSVQLAKVSRELDFKKVFYSNIGGIVVSGIAGIVVAYMGGGLWALVVQTMLNTLAACVVMYFTVRIRFHFVCNIRRIARLFGFGWKLLLSSLLETLYGDLSSLIIGRKYDTGTLAYYSRGLQFPQFLINSINGAIGSVMLPAMSAAQDEKNRVKEMMCTSMSMSAYIIFPLMAGLAAVAAPLISLLLTDKWLLCVPYMQVFCFELAFYPVHTCNLHAINAMGRSDWFLKLEIIKKIYGFTFLTIAVIFFDSPMAIAMTGVVTTGIGWFVNAYPNSKLIGYSFCEQVKNLLPMMIMASLMCGCVLLVGRGCSVMCLSDVVTLILQVLVGIAVYLFLSVVFKPYPYQLAMEMVSGFLKKKNQIREKYSL